MRFKSVSPNDLRILSPFPTSKASRGGETFQLLFDGAGLRVP
jgi:hypothetical protein